MGDPPRKRSAHLATTAAIAPEVYALSFELLAGDAMQFDAGQFVTFYVPKDSATITRSYSICSSPERTDGFELCIKRVEGGFVSTLLCSEGPGAELKMIGPLGKFLLRDPGDRAVVFLATGTGVAPFLPMAGELLHREPVPPTWLFFGGRTEEEILYRSRFEALQATQPAFHYVPALSRPGPGWTGATGHLEVPLRQRMPDLSKADVYICGVPQMVQEAQQLASTLHCPPDRVFLERY